jgi:transcription elongation factor Elf1
MKKQSKNITPEQKRDKEILKLLKKEEAEKEVIRKSLQDRSSFRARIMCPNCGVVAEVKNIDTHKTIIFSKRCKKCHLKFEWKYSIAETRKDWFPRHSYINVSAPIFLGDIYKFQKYNEKNVRVEK